MQHKFISSDSFSDEGSDDDGQLNRAIFTEKTDNIFVQMPRWNGGKIGPRRFTHMTDEGSNAMTNVSESE